MYEISVFCDDLQNLSAKLTGFGKSTTLFYLISLFCKVCKPVLYNYNNFDFIYFERNLQFTSSYISPPNPFPIVKLDRPTKYARYFWSWNNYHRSEINHVFRKRFCNWFVGPRIKTLLLLLINTLRKSCKGKIMQNKWRTEKSISLNWIYNLSHSVHTYWSCWANFHFYGYKNFSLLMYVKSFTF